MQSRAGRLPVADGAGRGRSGSARRRGGGGGETERERDRERENRGVLSPPGASTAAEGERAREPRQRGRAPSGPGGACCMAQVSEEEIRAAEIEGKERLSASLPRA